jgi:hypothetical protein
VLSPVTAAWEHERLLGAGRAQVLAIKLARDGTRETHWNHDLGSGSAASFFQRPVKCATSLSAWADAGGGGEGMARAPVDRCAAFSL